jgi:hypothetical protein
LAWAGGGTVEIGGVQGGRHESKDDGDAAVDGGDSSVVNSHVRVRILRSLTGIAGVSW